MKSFKQDPKEIDTFLNFLEEDLDNIRRVKEYLNEKDIDFEFEIHPKAETVDESVEYSPVNKEQIIKTLLFMIDDKPIGILCPGNKRVNETKIKELKGKEPRMANPSEVKKHTGYIIGGVSPFDLEIELYIDKSLLNHEEVRPAAGSRLVGVCLDPEDLKNIIGAKVADIAA